MQLYPLYTFDDDLDPEDDPCGGVKPLPEEVPIRHVYRSARLVELMQEHDANAAFCVWASETLGLYDHATEYAALHDIDVDALEAARGAYIVAVTEATAKKYGWLEIQPVLRERLQPFLDARMTMRQMAVYLNVSPREIVKVLMNGSATKRAEQLCDLEDEIVDGALDRMSQRHLLSKCGLPGAFNQLANLRARHAAAQGEAA